MTNISKLLPCCLVLAVFLVAAARAEDTRSWTDVDGRVIQAKMLGLDFDKVRVLFNGKEVAIPMSRLSEADHKYVEEWVPGGDDPAPAGGGGAKGAGTSSFDGRELVTGGHINIYEYDYTEEYIASLRKKYKDKAEDTGYRIAIAVPAGFDPDRPQKVFIAMSPGNNDGQIKAGNTAALRNFAGKGVEAGWVCVAYDSNLGLANVHTGAYHMALEKLLEVWPGFAGWAIATGGSSGGAKGALSHACLLISKDVPVRGVFLAGCNSAANMSWGRKTYKVRKADVRNMRVFISTGKNDNLVSRNQVQSVIATLRGEDVRTIRDEPFEGGHELNRDEFVKALGWFAQDTP